MESRIIVVFSRLKKNVSSCLSRGAKSKLSSHHVADVFRSDESSPKWSRPNLCFVMFDDFMIFVVSHVWWFLVRKSKGVQKKNYVNIPQFVPVRCCHIFESSFCCDDQKNCFRNVCLLRRFPQYQLAGDLLNKSIFPKNCPEDPKIPKS